MSAYGNFSLFVLLHLALTLSLINNMRYEVHGCKHGFFIEALLSFLGLRAWIWIHSLQVMLKHDFPVFEAQLQTIHGKCGPAVLWHFCQAIYFHSVNRENCGNLKPFNCKMEKKASPWTKQHIFHITFGDFTPFLGHGSWCGDLWSNRSSSLSWMADSSQWDRYFPLEPIHETLMP